MKKLCLSVAFVASLNFANAYEIPVYNGQLPHGGDHTIVDTIPSWVSVFGSPLGVSSHNCCYDSQLIPDGTSGVSRPYTIHNKKSQSISGFKLYHYFTAPPSRQFDVRVYRYFHANRYDRGAVMIDNAIQPSSIRVESLSATQYRAVLDYSNVTVAPWQRFPTRGAIYVRVVSTDSFGADGYELNGFAIESTSGSILYGPELNNEGTKEYPAIKRRIGVLTDDSACPDYSEIVLDVEDTNDATSINHVGNHEMNAIGVYKDNTTLHFKYCALSYSQLPQTAYGYAVLKLDSECPAGSNPIIRTHDTEDSNNADSYSGYIWPNSVSPGPSHAVLQYCYVSSKYGATLKYPFEKKYGIFGGSRSNLISDYIAVNEVYVDDENNNNQNHWDRSAVPSHLRMSSKSVMDDSNDGKKNTVYYVIRWTGPGSAMLAKSVDAADVRHVENETYVAAAPLAPAIKGLNRVAVAVELKSFGDAKISVVDVKGTKIAQVVEKNLQPGVHQIKWNSGMVPSGRYIVKIEQNGMVNAKNVILK